MCHSLSLSLSLSFSLSLSRSLPFSLSRSLSLSLSLSGSLITSFYIPYPSTYPALLPSTSFYHLLLPAPPCHFSISFYRPSLLIPAGSPHSQYDGRQHWSAPDRTHRRRPHHLLGSKVTRVHDDALFPRSAWSAWCTCAFIRSRHSLRSLPYSHFSLPSSPFSLPSSSFSLPCSSHGSPRSLIGLRPLTHPTRAFTIHSFIPSCSLPSFFRHTARSTRSLIGLRPSRSQVKLPNNNGTLVVETGTVHSRNAPPALLILHATPIPLRYADTRCLSHMRPVGPKRVRFTASSFAPLAHSLYSLSSSSLFPPPFS